MNYAALPAGNKVPEEINAIVEIPKGEGRIKYEYRNNGTIVVDRLRGANEPLYPAHYCGVPATLGTDGDPLDLIILGDDKFKTGDVIAVRPIAVFWMTDEKGSDPKIIAVPADSVSEDYLHMQSLADIPPAERQKIEKFFQDYKKNDLKGKWSKSNGWDDIDVAHKTINECVANWKKSQAPAPSKSQNPPPPKP